jgi:hypothetical protein
MFDVPDDSWSVIPPFPPFLGINYQYIPGSQMYAYADSPIMGHAPWGYGGYFYFSEPTNFTAGFVAVPEPSTYGMAALLMLAGAIAWRRIHRAPDVASGLA